MYACICIIMYMWCFCMYIYIWCVFMYIYSYMWCLHNHVLLLVVMLHMCIYMWSLYSVQAVTCVMLVVNASLSGVCVCWCVWGAVLALLNCSGPLYVVCQRSFMWASLHVFVCQRTDVNGDNRTNDSDKRFPDRLTRVYRLYSCYVEANIYHQNLSASGLSQCTSSQSQKNYNFASFCKMFVIFVICKLL